MTNKYNFNVVPNDEQEEFNVEFGETIRIAEKDFNKLENRPSYNGTPMTGDTNIPEVPSAVSQLTNDADYQTGTDVQNSISSHNGSEEAHPYLQGLIGEKQDQLTAGTNISIDNNVISATDTRYSAGNGLNLSSENAFSVDTTVIATQQNLASEVTNRENADNALQAQIDGISASSDVVDIVGTYAELQQYDTQHLKDNDIIKVLQDETQGDATTYYRWSITTETFTLIGQEGPYYTKAAADSQFVPQTRTVNGKALSSNITLNASDVSALGTSDVVQTTGTSTRQVMSQNAVTTGLNSKLNASDYVVDTQLADSSNPVQNRVINNLLGNMPTDFFTAGETVSGEGTNITLNNTIAAPIDDVELEGNTFQQTYSGKNLLDIPDGYTGISSGVTTTWSNNIATSNASSTTSTTCTLTSTLAFKSTIPAGTYTFSVQSSTSQYYPILRLKDTSNIWHNYSITAGENSVTITTDYSADTAQLSLGLWTTGTTITNFVTEYPMLEVGSSATSYEPYVGGTASPNPDYPQDVQVVTGEQNVWVHGKNLIDNTDTTYDYSNIGSQYINITSLSTGLRFENTYTGTGSPIVIFKIFDATPYIGKTVRLKANFDNASSVYRIIRMDSNASNRTVLATASESGQELSYTIPDNLGATNYIGFGFGSPVGTTVNYTNLIMTIDNADMAYQPYQSQSYTVNLTSKNLFDKTATPRSSAYSTASQITNGIRVASTRDATGSSFYVLYLLGNTKDYIGKTLTLSANMQASASNVPRVMLGLCDSSGGNASGKVNLYENGSVSYQVENDTTRQYLFLAIYSTAGGAVQVGDYVDYTNIQLEVGSTATPYTDYFTPIELCKIGNYQDYIYKSGDDWYVHKDCGKYVFTGSESWQSSAYGTNSWSLYNLLSFPFDTTKLQIMSEAFRGVPHSQRGSAGDNIIYVAGNNVFEIRNTSLTSLANVQSATNGTDLYYALATPTDTKITDNTLIGELEALWGARSYLYTTQFITSATGTNLPVILDVDAYRKSLAGTLGAIERLSE